MDSTTDAVIVPPSATGSGALVKPAPRCPVSVRPALPGDLPFIDQLQKMHTHMVGFFPSKQRSFFASP